MALLSRGEYKSHKSSVGWCLRETSRDLGALEVSKENFLCVVTEAPGDLHPAKLPNPDSLGKRKRG